MDKIVFPSEKRFYDMISRVEKRARREHHRMWSRRIRGDKDGVVMTRDEIEEAIAPSPSPLVVKDTGVCRKALDKTFGGKVCTKAGNSRKIYKRMRAGRYDMPANVFLKRNLTNPFAKHNKEAKALLLNERRCGNLVKKQYDRKQPCPRKYKK